MDNLVDGRPGPGCFWYPARELFGLPNIEWCEAHRCSLIEQPASAHSNLVIIAVGILIMLSSRKDRERVRMRFFGWTILITGILSYIYHASNNWLTQIFDFAGMYLYSGFLLTLNLRRLGKITPAREIPIYVDILILNLIVFFTFHYALHIKIQYTFILNLVILIATEIVIRARNKNYRLKWFYWSLATIIFAESWSLADAARFFCQPDNLFFHGHAIWHCFSGLASLFTYYYYRQFDFSGKTVTT